MLPDKAWKVTAETNFAPLSESTTCTSAPSLPKGASALPPEAKRAAGHPKDDLSPHQIIHAIVLINVLESTRFKS